MAYSAADARREILDELAASADDLALSLACLGEAYEHLDERTADRLEEELFGPVQKAYGRAKATHAGFAARHGLPGRDFAPGSPGHGGRAVRELIDEAVTAATRAGDRIGELQDTMLPVEVGDAELRAGLADVRVTLDHLPARAREITRVLGR